MMAKIICSLGYQADPVCMARALPRVSKHPGRKQGKRQTTTVVYMGPAAHTPLHFEAVTLKQAVEQLLSWLQSPESKTAPVRHSAAQHVEGLQQQLWPQPRHPR